MVEQKYNGWANYPTWEVNLQISNDYGSQLYWQDRADEIIQEIADNMDGYDLDSITMNPVYELSNELKYYYEDEVYNILDAECNFFPFAASFMWAMEQVNWYEIAEAMLEGWEDKIRELLDKGDE